MSALLLTVLLVGQADVNPPHPEAARLLAEKAACLGFARECGEHILGRAKETEHGLTCTGKADVYAGDAGVALFLFRLHAATKEARWKDAAAALLAHARATDAGTQPGLYTGAAGLGEVCLEAWRATGEQGYLDHARACAARIGEPEVTDIISGAAGSGIFLLNLHAATGERTFLLRARAVGDYLVEAAVRDGDSARWHVVPKRGTLTYIGFSHGAAGVGYFLLHLHRVTKEATYGDAAVAAARFVEARAVPDGDGWKWTKMHPPRKDAYPVQWCHGSPGIGLFFCDLERHLGRRWAAPLDRCLASTRRDGRTARVGGCQCHGVSGNAELFVEAYRLRGDEALLEPARRFGSALLEPHGGGFRVPARIGRYTYPPGYMLGLAGIGQYFLRLAAPRETPLPLMVRQP